MASRAEVEGGAAWLLTVGSLQASASFAILSRSEELQHERELATAQEEIILQEDLLPQESPAEPPPEKAQNPVDGFTLTYYISSV